MARAQIKIHFDSILIGLELREQIGKSQSKSRFLSNLILSLIRSAIRESDTNFSTNFLLVFSRPFNETLKRIDCDFLRNLMRAAEIGSQCYYYIIEFEEL